MAPGLAASTSEATRASAAFGPFGAGTGHPGRQSGVTGWCRWFFGSQGKAWLPQGFPKPPLPANLAAPTGCDNLWMKNSVTVLKHATSWGFIGGVAAPANGLNNLAVAFGEKTTALFCVKYLSWSLLGA